MTFETAMFAWNNLCFKSVGIDGNGEQVDEITKFGAFVLGANAPLFISQFSNPHAQEQLEAASMLLHAWTDAIDKRISEIKKGI
jgi:hypothetical protein